MSEHLRERLDRLLMLVEQGKDESLRDKVAWILNIIPITLSEINAQILVVDKPNLKKLMGITHAYKTKKAIIELQKYQKREDLLGQVCDLILRIATNQEEESLNQ
jgi:hypothetical protein